MMPMRMRTGKKTLLPRFLNAERTSCAVLTGATNQLTGRSACACNTELGPEPRFASERREAERRTCSARLARLGSGRAGF